MGADRSRTLFEGMSALCPFARKSTSGKSPLIQKPPSCRAPRGYMKCLEPVRGPVCPSPTPPPRFGKSPADHQPIQIANGRLEVAENSWASAFSEQERNKAQQHPGCPARASGGTAPAGLVDPVIGIVGPARDGDTPVSV